jgi:hypothetical protein
MDLWLGDDTRTGMTLCDFVIVKITGADKEVRVRVLWLPIERASHSNRAYKQQGSI